MSKNLKIFLGVSYLLILFFFLYFIFTAIEINRLDDFAYYKEIQTNLGEEIISNEEEALIKEIWHQDSI